MRRAWAGIIACGIAAAAHADDTGSFPSSSTATTAAPAPPQPNPYAPNPYAPAGNSPYGTPGAAPATAPTAAAPNATVPAATAPAATPPPFDASPFSSFIAIIEGDAGKGTGFVAKLKDGPALITNGHVLSGQSKFTVQMADGSSFAPEHYLFTENRDLAAMRSAALTAAGDGIEVVDNVNKDVKVGDDVVVLGNSLGAGVATQLAGKVVAIGPSLVEVDAPFVPGNSGSPVIHVKSGKVIGIASYSTIRKAPGQFGKDSSLYGKERRFAYRLDNVAAWTEVPWSLFSREGAIVADVEDLTDCLDGLATDIDKNHKVNYDKFTDPNNPLRGTVTDFRDQLEKSRMSDHYYMDVKKQFLWFVVDECTKDLAPLNPVQFSPYHKMRLRELIEQRQDLAGYFKALYDYQDSQSQFNSGAGH